jgi:predicted nucleotidyltransferase
MGLTDNEIEMIREYLSYQPVLRAYLFGSYARNQATSDSDIDLLVELDYSQHIGLGFLGMKYDLEEKLKKEVDLISANGISKYIKPSIMKDKILIYE